MLAVVRQVQKLELCEPVVLVVGVMHHKAHLLMAQTAQSILAEAAAADLVPKAELIRQAVFKQVKMAVPALSSSATKFN